MSRVRCRFFGDLEIIGAKIREMSPVFVAHGTRRRLDGGIVEKQQMYRWSNAAEEKLVNRNCAGDARQERKGGEGVHTNPSIYVSTQRLLHTIHLISHHQSSLISLFALLSYFLDGPFFSSSFFCPLLVGLLSTVF